MTKLTQEIANEYLETGGIDCPFCGGEDTVTADRIDPGTGVAECCCSQCEATWIEYWKMIGIQADGEYDPEGEPFYLEEPKCHIRVVEQMLDEYQQETYLVAILFSPENKTSAILLESDEPLSTIFPKEYDKFIESCQEQARLWHCELDIRVKKEDYFDPNEPDEAYETV